MRTMKVPPLTNGDSVPHTRGDEPHFDPGPQTVVPGSVIRLWSTSPGEPLHFLILVISQSTKAFQAYPSLLHISLVFQESCCP